MRWLKKYKNKIIVGSLAVSLCFNFYFGNKTTKVTVASNNVNIKDQTIIYDNKIYQIVAYNFDIKSNDQAIFETKATDFATGDTVKLSVAGKVEVAKWGEAKWGEAKYE